MSMSSIHIILVTYNSADCLGPFLASMSRQTFGDWRIIAIDNASGDTTMSMLSGVEESRLQVISNSMNLGFAAAVNQGIRIAAAEGADRFILLNPDTELPPCFLEAFQSEWERLAADVIVPRIMLRDSPQTSWYAGGGFDRGWLFTNRHDHHIPGATLESRKVEFASGCCLGLSRAALEQVGLLDESFFVYWEDADLCLRLGRSGIPIWYVPAVFLLHESGASSGGERSPTAMKLFNRNYIVFLRKHFGLAYAVRTIVRVIGREAQRPTRNWGEVAHTFLAMLPGLWRPRRPVPHL